MSASTHPGNPALARIIEKQMRNWELARRQRRDVPRADRPEVADFVAMSYEIGSGGEDVAIMLGEALNRPVFDRQVLQEMAGNDDIRKRLYQSLDERDLNWFQEVMLALGLDQFKKNDYFHRLTTTILAIARRGPAVFLGRAADLILPRDRGFRANIVRPREERVQRFAASRALAQDEADAELIRLEAEREEFVRHHFRRDPNEATRYDLVINMHAFGLPQAVELMLAARRLKARV